MKEPGCELSQQAKITDENWRDHAQNCIECSEVLKLGQWMNSLADTTAVPTLPTVGFLMAKKRIREKQAAVRRAARPVQIMTAFIATVLAVSIGMLLSSQTHVTLSIVNAVSMIVSLAGVILAGLLLAALVYAAATYLMNESHRYSRTKGS